MLNADQVSDCPPHLFKTQGYLKICQKCSLVVDTENAVRKYTKEPRAATLSNIISPRKKQPKRIKW